MGSDVFLFVCILGMDLQVGLSFVHVRGWLAALITANEMAPLHSVVR